jgi:hypothetical protein
MKNRKIGRKLLSMLLSIAMITTMTFIINPGISVSAVTTIHVVTDSSPAVYKNAPGAVNCPNGVLPSSLKNSLSSGNVIAYFAPGEYWVEGSSRQFSIGSNTSILGETPVTLPTDKSVMLYPDSATKAVFATRTFLATRTPASSTQIAYINTVSGANNITVQDVEFSGYIILKLNSVTNSTVKNVLIHNYNGTYPNGTWCNMGYSVATATLWLYGNCDTVTLENINVQCSSHHSYAIHTGSPDNISKNIYFKNCRSLYGGCGQLRGDNPTNVAESQAAVPETEGYGYMDWSVGFDFCENQSIDNVQATDCYALDAWKAGFYTEPEATGGHITNLSLKRCVSVNGGQRALLRDNQGNPVSPRVTIVRETEGCNFYMQGGYFEDCISVNGEKCGWLLGLERGEEVNPGKGICEMIRCGDRGSPVSIASEMRLANNFYCDSFRSVLPTRYAFELFGDNKDEVDGHIGNPRPSNIELTNSTIIAGTNLNPPIAVCKMERMQLIESRSKANQSQVKAGGKYDMFNPPINIDPGILTGKVYNYPSGDLVYIHKGNGNKWNSSQDAIAAASGLARENAAVNPDDFITMSGVYGPGAPVAVTGVSLNKSSVALNVPKTFQLSATVLPANATVETVKWTTSNSKVATVSSTGKVTAKGPGTASITATTVSGSKKAICKFTVKQLVTGVKLNKKSLTLTRGKTFKLTATIVPSNASNKKVTWKSTNTKIATVGSTGIIKAKAKGTVYIKVYTVDGKKSATCKVIVK